MNTSLHPFTDADWESFPGCESESPLVAYPRPEAAVILDGIAVHVFKTQKNGIIANYAAKFADPTSARLAAESLASDTANVGRFGLKRLHVRSLELGPIL